MPTPLDRADRYCIIGAGSSGLTAAKNLKQLGIPFDIFEREDGVGGNWYYGKPHSSVCRSTHLISSKPLTEYRDFPMPAGYPPYPSHEQVLSYFVELL
jgi:cation diffusion facilitator CzcD-associated flavoprotein CzcO